MKQTEINGTSKHCDQREEYRSSMDLADRIRTHAWMS